MPAQHDPRTPAGCIRYQYARPHICDGDLLLFRGNGLIPWASEGPYSHAAIALWRGRVLALAEAREWIGARVVTLSSQVRKHPGRIDVFRPLCGLAIRERAADLAFRQAGHAYGYAAVAWASLLRLPILRAIAERFTAPLDPVGEPDALWHESKFCSQLFLWCYRRASSTFDPVPNLADRYCTPNHLSHSSSFAPMFRGLLV